MVKAAKINIINANVRNAQTELATITTHIRLLRTFTDTDEKGNAKNQYY